MIQRFRRAAPTGPAAHATRTATAVASQARNYLHASYCWGAGHDHIASHRRVDCSGLIQQVARDLGVRFEGTAAQMQRRGKPVSMAHLKPGDLLFHGHPATHVGIYIGNGKAIHASSVFGHVMTVSLSHYHYFNNARRVF